MFQTLPLPRFSNGYEHLPLTSVVMMASCKVGLNKAAYQAVGLPANISGSVKVRAGLVTQNEVRCHCGATVTDGVERLFTAMAIATFSVKEVSESQRNQFALDGVKFLKFISDCLITEEQWPDNYICNN